MHKFRFFIEYSAVNLIRWAVLCIPGALSNGAGRCLGYLLRLFAVSRTELIKKNLRSAFPEKPDAEIERITAACWENIGRNIVEFAKLPRLNKENLTEQVDFEGLEHLDESLKLERGVIILGSHYCNWEIIGASLALKGYRIAVLARSLKNPYVDGLVNAIRSSSDEVVVPHRDAVRESIRWLKNKYLLGILIDQRITSGGISVDFLGRPAATTSIIPLLFYRFLMPVIPIYSTREDGRIKIHIGPPMDMGLSERNDENTLRITQMLTARIEEWIKDRPELWFWVHNRWK